MESHCINFYHMKKQKKPILILGLIALSWSGLCPASASLIDQQQPVIDLTVGGLAIGGDSQQKVAQVVTAGISGFLTEVRFPITCQSADLIVEIQGVTDQKPNGII